RLRVVNAAHAAGFIRRQSRRLETLCPDEHAGFPLGVAEGLPYDETAFDLAAGDAVVIVTDGITNAANAAGEEFGTARLRQIVAATEPRAAKLGEALLASVHAFAAGQRMDDDVVVVCFARDLP